ncbi:MAG: M15 family metallopeptidase [Flavobacteriales bacterium]
MRKNITIISAVNFLLLVECSSPGGNSPSLETVDNKESALIDLSHVVEQNADTGKISAIPQPDFINIHTLDTTIIIDMPYADTANFTHNQIYSCAVCELRPEVANALAKANATACAKGYCIKVFDCYRPSSAQQKMYDVVPDKKYVAHPSKGSKHGSGCAVDVTLCNTWAELDMGTPFDDFTEKSHLGYKGLSKEQQQNRALLLQIMKGAGFSEYTNEWWHFNFIGCDHPQDDHHWECK